MADFNIDIAKELGRIGKEVQDLVNKVVPIVDEDIDFLPAFDLLEGDEKFVVYMDLPGLDKKDIKVSVDQNVVRISGERKHEGEHALLETLRNERKSGAFTRSISLPSEVEKQAIKARFKHGVLVVDLPKRKGHQQDDIPVE